MEGMNPSSDLAKLSLEQFLHVNPSIDFLRFQFVDYGGVIRVRVATKLFALSLAQKEKPISLFSPILTVGLIGGTPLMDDIDTGEDELWPDWSSLRVCTYKTGHASVMCFVKEGGHNSCQSYLRCPRMRLHQVIKSAKQKHDIDFLCGFEIEFVIMHPAKDDHPARVVQTDVNFYSSASIRNPYLEIIEEIIHCLLNAGVKVRQFHSEGWSGMFELSTEPLPPLQAADALIFSHEAIKTICANHNLHATMYPKPFGELEPTVGLHTHISISRLEKESCFLAGVIDSWAALAAFYMPNYDSNSRLFEDEWVSWGSGDKSKCIRKVNEGHWEFRSVDATSNVYLVLLAIFTAGLAGFEAERQLTVKDPKKCAFKAMSREEASNFGIVDRMPRSLKKAIENLRGDIRLRDALGPELFDRYLYFKIKEEEAFSKMSRNKRRDISMQLF